MKMMIYKFFLSSRRRHTRCALVTGVQTCALLISTLYSYHRDSTDIEEWLVNTVLRAERIKRAVEMDYFPRTDNGCLTYNRPCEFTDICQTREIGRASCRERVCLYV